MRTRLTVTVAMAILLFVAACGGGDAVPEATATPVPTPSPPDPAALYSAMAAKVMAAPSLHASTTFQETGESGTMEIDYLPPDRAQLTLVIEVPEEGEVTSEAIIIGDRLFVRFGDFQGWFEVPSDDDEFREITGFMEFFSGVLAATPDLTDIAEEALGEVAAFHLQGTLDSDILESLGETNEENTATFDVWVSAEDTLPLRLLVQAMPREFVLDISITLLDTPLPIEVPDAVVGLDIFDQLIEGSLDPQALPALISVLPSNAQECLQAQLQQGTLDELISGDGELGSAEGLVIQSCLGEILMGVGTLAGLGPDDLEAGLSGTAGGAGELLGLLPAEAEDCIKETIGSDLFEGWMSGEEVPTTDQIVAIGPCIGAFDIGDVGEIDLDVPDADGLAQIIGELGQQAEGCLRSVWGDAAFEEIKSGTRPPNLAELGAMAGCVDAPQGGTGDEGPDNSSTDLPEDFGEVLGQMPTQVLECFTAAVGADAIGELRDGLRLPGLAELGAIRACFDEIEDGG